eukprot:11865-Eustigmatos_ZCMA.PRE.1
MSQYSGGYTGSNSTVASGVTYNGDYLQLQLPLTVLVKPTSTSITWLGNTTFSEAGVICGSTNGSTWTYLASFPTGSNFTSTASITSASYFSYIRWCFTGTGT